MSNLLRSGENGSQESFQQINVMSYNFFNKLKDQISHALFAVAIGCNVFLGEVHNYGPEKTSEVKRKMKNLLTIEIKKATIHSEINIIVFIKNLNG